jgi:hypothetical protein
MNENKLNKIIRESLKATLKEFIDDDMWKDTSRNTPRREELPELPELSADEKKEWYKKLKSRQKFR